MTRRSIKRVVQTVQASSMYSTKAELKDQVDQLQALIQAVDIGQDICRRNQELGLLRTICRVQEKFEERFEIVDKRFDTLQVKIDSLGSEMILKLEQQILKDREEKAAKSNGDTAKEVNDDIAKESNDDAEKELNDDPGKELNDVAVGEEFETGSTKPLRSFLLRGLGQTECARDLKTETNKTTPEDHVDRGSAADDNSAKPIAQPPFDNITELIGQFDGDPLDLSRWTRAVDEIWYSNNSPQFRRSLLQALPKTMTGKAHMWIFQVGFKFLSTKPWPIWKMSLAARIGGLIDRKEKDTGIVLPDFPESLYLIESECEDDSDSDDSDKDGDGAKTKGKTTMPQKWRDVKTQLYKSA
ncbi:unnamed protein product [Sympodiomycopsis kandeliae]